VGVGVGVGVAVGVGLGVVVAVVDFRQPGSVAVRWPVMTQLHHERLDAYQTAIEFLALTSTLQYPKGHAALSDQLRRAALSIPLNIAEGYGKRTDADRNRFYDVARGSAHECGAVLDAAMVLGILDEETHRRSKALLVRIVSMLVRMVR
jgi:four helix bundle protein